MKREAVQAELARELGRLQQSLEEDLAAVGNLRAVEALGPRLERLRADLGRQLERLRDPAVITLVGATGAGKSTLLNALVERSVALEGESRPTTVRPVVYAPAGAELDGLLTDLPGPEPAVVHYGEGAGRGPWSEQVLIDAPDINSVASEHREVVRALAERSDALVVLVHHQSMVEESSVSFVDEFAGRRHMIFALGRADELNAESRAALLSELQRLARERWRAPSAPVLAVSPRAAQTRPDSEGWPELVGALRDLVAQKLLAGVRRENALGTAARLGELFAAAEKEAGSDLQSLPLDVHAGVARLNGRLSQELAERLRFRRPDLLTQLWSEAARRWDGPGGFALRAHGLGTLGLGAGALLLRRSPLLAAGAAAGAVAADRTRQAVQRSRLESTGGLLPGEREFETWYLDALGEARLRAARLMGSPEALGLPRPAEAREQVGAVVHEAWEHLLERDLPHLAERSLPVWLRWPLDLPVYLLGGWVVWKAATGFFAEQYLGLDFLVNALLLVIAYLFVVGFSVRRLLTWRARGLLVGVLEEAAGGLAAWGESTHRTARDATLGPREVLGRLAGLGARWRDALLRD